MNTIRSVKGLMDLRNKITGRFDDINVKIFKLIFAKVKVRPNLA